jgi:hypothetical protein
MYFVYAVIGLNFKIAGAFLLADSIPRDHLNVYSVVLQSSFYLSTWCAKDVLQYIDYLR